MPECDYCGASYDTEEAHLDHLESEHYDELGPIDKRRIDDRNEGSGFPTGPVAIGVVLLAAAGIVGYVVFVAGGSGGANIGQAGSAHYHGTMEMTVLGNDVDFSQDRFQLRDDRFHFEGGDGTEWHVHASGVTFEYAMNALGFEVELEPKTLVADDTYTDGEGYEVVFEVNGEEVTDLDYVLKRDDHIRIVVREA